jgi:hypothetical protein
MTHMHYLYVFFLEQSVLPSRGALSLFTELPRRPFFSETQHSPGPIEL